MKLPFFCCDPNIAPSLRRCHFFYFFVLMPRLKRRRPDENGLADLTRLSSIKLWASWPMQTGAISKFCISRSFHGKPYRHRGEYCAWFYKCVKGGGARSWCVTHRRFARGVMVRMYGWRLRKQMREKRCEIQSLALAGLTSPFRPARPVKWRSTLSHCLQVTYFRRHSVKPPGLSSSTMPAASSCMRIASARLKSRPCLAALRSFTNASTSSCAVLAAPCTKAAGAS